MKPTTPAAPQSSRLDDAPTPSVLRVMLDDVLGWLPPVEVVAVASLVVGLCSVVVGFSILLGTPASAADFAAKIEVGSRLVDAGGFLMGTSGSWGALAWYRSARRRARDAAGVEE